MMPVHVGGRLAEMIAAKLHLHYPLASLPPPRIVDRFNPYPFINSR
jgi:hypothetical protein